MRTILLAIAITLITGSVIFADDWPQWRGPTRDGAWLEEEVVRAFVEKELKPRWRVPISSGYSGPTVADGRVYVTDRVTKPEQMERVHCFDWQTGDQLWSYSYPSEYRDVGFPAGPRASVLVHEGRAYSLGAMGHLHSFDAINGKLLWKRDLNDEYKIEMPVWGISSSPLIEGDLIILQIGGNPGACLVAFDRVSGEERWRALDDQASYSSPRIIEQAGKRVLLCWTVEHVVGLDPQSGEVYWKHPFGNPSSLGMIVADPALSGRRLFLTAFFDGSMMLDVDPDSMAVSEIWSRAGQSENDTDALHTTMSTPLLIGNHIYGVDSYGELRCLDAGTGDRVWADSTAVPHARWANIHFVRNGSQVWMFNERGELLITTLSPNGLEVISRAALIEPTLDQLNQRDGVCWSHPAFAYKHVFVRNDEALVCASLEP